MVLPTMAKEISDMHSLWRRRKAGITEMKGIAGI
jgi:hypothetical protein